MSGGDKSKKGPNKQARKHNIFTRITTLFDNYEKILVVGADNVG